MNEEMGPYCPDCRGTGTDGQGLTDCLLCSGTGLAGADPVRVSIRRSLEMHRKTLASATDWMVYTAQCVAYYEEWDRTGNSPAWPFPEWRK